MAKRDLKIRIEKASITLHALPQLIAAADQDAGKAFVSGLWPALIEAAVRDVYYQLTGDQIQEPSCGKGVRHA
jgi:hypothetical protein